MNVQGALVCALGLVAAVIAGCHDKPQSYETTVDVLHVQRFGQSSAPGIMDLELRFSDCPGDARRVVRLDKAFSQCIGQVKAGEKLSATMSHAWSAERGGYRSDLVKLGKCPVKLDPKEEANYEMVQVCTDLEVTGANVGVHCDRSRPPELLNKCPWFRRN